MSDLTESEVIEYAEALLKESQQVRDEAVRFDLVNGMYSLPKLPPELARDEAVFVLSPDVMHEERETRARIMTFVTEVQCNAMQRTAGDTIGDQVQRQVDHLEKTGAVWLSRLDPNLVVKQGIVHDQLIQPASIAILEMGPIDSPDPEKRFPWRLFGVTFDGCGWLEREGIPTVFGRQYSEFVGDVLDRYSGRKDGPEGPGARLDWNGGKFDWKPLSDDFSRRNTPHISDAGEFEAVDQVWLDDGNRIYHVALNRASEGVGVGKLRFGKSSKREGKLVWSGPNPFGSCSAHVIGSNVNPKARLLHDKYLPHLMDLLSNAEVENVVMSIRATASRNRSAPHDYWHVDPQLLAQLYRENGNKMPEATEWAEGKTPVGFGELKARPVDVDPDFEHLAQELTARRQRYVSGMSSTFKDADVLKNSTLGALLAAYDSENASLSLLVGAHDTFQRRLLEQFEASVLWLADPKNSGDGYACGPQYAKFSMRARGGELVSTKTLGGGETFEFDDKSFEVAHEWRVITSQRSRGQTQAEFAAAAERMQPLSDGRPGVGIYSDLFTAVGVSDIDERKATLAKEALMFETVTPMVTALVKQSLDYEIDLDSGIQVQLIPPAEGPPGATQSGGPPDTAPPPKGGPEPPSGTHATSPVTEPTSGGSGPNLVGG